MPPHPRPHARTTVATAIAAFIPFVLVLLLVVVLDISRKAEEEDDDDDEDEQIQMTIRLVTSAATDSVLRFIPNAGSDIYSRVSELTVILQRMDQGDPQAAEQLLPLVYEELRKLAAIRMARESPGQTLQATALVHEAWLRLGGDEQPEWRNRAHFFAAAAEAMRRILIDNARRKNYVRHGGGLERVNLAGLELAAQLNDEQLLALHDALDHLAQHDAQKAELVKLRFFTGLTNEQVAQVLGVSDRPSSVTGPTRVPGCFEN